MSRLTAALFLAAAPAAALAAAIDVEVRDAAGRPAPDAAVYAMPAAGALEARPGKAAVQIEQVEREFVPYLTVLQTGTTASFPNRDPILHHVYSFSPAKTFEIKLYTGRSPSSVTFDKPGVVTLGCNIHDWMIGYLYVTDAPYFGKTAAAGRVELKDLPAGTYRVHVWHPRLDGGEEATTQQIEVKDDAAVSAQWKIKLKREFRPQRAPLPGDAGYR
jgi:plastocyanin